MNTLQVGDTAPEFSTTAVGGNYGSGARIKLSELKGSPVILYFYPKDDTPGCTTQACGIRDAWKPIKAIGVHLFGVSTDGEKYMGTERTTFLVDPKGKIAAIFPKVKPVEHAELLLKALKDLQG
jgi:peroxiredoxin Q/BCP